MFKQKNLLYKRKSLIHKIKHKTNWKNTNIYHDFYYKKLISIETYRKTGSKVYVSSFCILIYERVSVNLFLCFLFCVIINTHSTSKIIIILIVCYRFIFYVVIVYSFFHFFYHKFIQFLLLLVVCCFWSFVCLTTKKIHKEWKKQKKKMK